MCIGGGKRCVWRRSRDIVVCPRFGSDDTRLSSSPPPSHTHSGKKAEAEVRGRKLEGSLQEKLQEATTARQALEAAQRACGEREAAVRI